MILKENYILSNGIAIPKLGLGTWFISATNAVNAVDNAIKLGYRHIDTAQAYRNEKGVGLGIKKSGINREDVFITTKLSAGAKSYKKAEKAIENSLKKLDVDYIDLMIIHSPQPWTKFRGEDRFFKGNLEAWKALENAYEAGKIKAIGVSNFEKEDLANLIENGKVKPMINQVLAHIGKIPSDLISYCTSENILVEAYSPIAHGVLLEHDDVKRIATKYNTSIAQLSIKYLLQLRLLPIPKTANPEHMKTNATLNFTISEADMEILHQLAEITNYGDANLMPVYGGKLNFTSILKMILKSFKG